MTNLTRISPATCTRPISEAKATGRESDGAVIRCANCDGYVCLGGCEAHVSQGLDFCDDYPALPDASWVAGQEWLDRRDPSQIVHRASDALELDLKGLTWRERVVLGQLLVKAVPA